MMGTSTDPGLAPRILGDILASGARVDMQVLEVYKADAYCLLEYMEKKASAPRNIKPHELYVEEIKK